MPMNDPLHIVNIVKREVRGMKHSILHALESHHDAIIDAVEKEVEGQLESLDIAAMARDELPGAIRKSISDAIRRGVNEAMRDEGGRLSKEASEVVAVHLMRVAAILDGEGTE